MLTGAEIRRLVQKGEIRISDFSEERLNPNSYNLRLGNKLLIYDISVESGDYLDSKKKNPTKEIIIPEDGYVLRPGVFYLGTTMESTYAKNHIANIDGRSSAARLSLEVHRTAGFGDIGFDGTWTLEMTTMLPLKIYPGQEICQVYFETPEGDTSIKYHGRYQHQDGTTASRLYMSKEEIEDGFNEDNERNCQISKMLDNLKPNTDLYHEFVDMVNECEKNDWIHWSKLYGDFREKYNTITFDKLVGFTESYNNIDDGK